MSRPSSATDDDDMGRGLGMGLSIALGVLCGVVVIVAAVFS